MRTTNMVFFYSNPQSVCSDPLEMTRSSSKVEVDPTTKTVKTKALPLENKSLISRIFWCCQLCNMKSIFFNILAIHLTIFLHIIYLLAILEGIFTGWVVKYHDFCT